MTSSEWTVAQLLVLDRMAGALSTSELVEELALHGPRHGERAVVQQAAVGKISLRRRIRRHAWSEEEDRFILAHAGAMPPAWIAIELRRRYFYPRTRNGVCLRAGELGVGLASRLLTLRTVKEILAVCRSTVLGWVNQGYLLSVHASSGKHGSRWWFSEAGVEAFLRTHPRLYDWQAVQAGRWREIARVASISEPWLASQQAARTLRRTDRSMQRAARSGAIEGAVKVGRNWRIPGDALVPRRRTA